MFDTRWSDLHDTVRALNKRYKKNVSALEKLANDGNLTEENRLEAEGFLKKPKQLTVVSCFKYGAQFQTDCRNPTHPVKKVDFLWIQLFIWWNLFSILLKTGDLNLKGMKMKSEFNDYKDVPKRQNKRNRHFDESISLEALFSLRKRLNVEEFLLAIDKLSSVLKHRLNAYIRKFRISLALFFFRA